MLSFSILTLLESSSFDKMALRAEMHASLEKRQPKTLVNSKNGSKVILA